MFGNLGVKVSLRGEGKQFFKQVRTWIHVFCSELFTGSSDTFFTRKKILIATCTDIAFRQEEKGQY